MYPFLFLKSPHDLDDLSHVKVDKWYVKVAKCFDYVGYDSSWMACEHLGNHCLIPDVDLCDTEDVHEFSSEAEAMEFIRQWWRKN